MEEVLEEVNKLFESLLEGKKEESKNILKRAISDKITCLSHL